MRYHARDGLYFERLPDGGVKVRMEPVNGAPAEVELSADAWASVVATVSARGDTADTRNEARRYHDRGG